VTDQMKLIIAHILVNYDMEVVEPKEGNVANLVRVRLKMSAKNSTAT